MARTRYTRYSPGRFVGRRYYPPVAQNIYAGHNLNQRRAIARNRIRRNLRRVVNNRRQQRADRMADFIEENEREWNNVDHRRYAPTVFDDYYNFRDHHITHMREPANCAASFIQKHWRGNRGRRRASTHRHLFNLRRKTHGDGYKYWLGTYPAFYHYDWEYKRRK